MSVENKNVVCSSKRDRVVLYTSPVVTSVLLAIVFCQLALHQIRLRELERHIKHSRGNDDVQLRKQDIKRPADTLALRYTREEEGTEEVSTSGDYFGLVAEQQVMSNKRSAALI